MNKIIYTAIACILSFAQGTFAADVRGIVVDEFSRPMAGVKVRYDGGVSLTGIDGSFAVSTAWDHSPLTFSFPGYGSVTLTPEESGRLDVSMVPDAHFKDETIELGYTTQSRNSVSGAVSVIRGEELARQTTTNIGQALSGNLLGLSYFESNNNLFNAEVGMVSRGISTLSTRDMLIVIDGMVCPTDDYKWLDPQELESVTLLKDASVTAIYGIQGANGVLVFKTKRGHVGMTRTRVYYDHSFQQMTKRPLFINSAEYAMMRNQAAYNDNPSVGRFSQFTQKEIDGYRTGIGYYPDNNWTGMYLKKMTQMQRAGVDVSGGSERVQYYSQLSYTHQGSQFWTDKNQDKYDSEPAMHLIKARTNLDLNINKHLSGFASMSANMTRYILPISPGDGGMENSRNIYGRLFNLPPTVYGPTTEPDGQGAVTTTEKEEFPVYGVLNRSGYYIRTTTNFLAHAGLKLDMGFLTEGLSLSGSLAFQGTAAQLEENYQDYARQIRDLSGGYDTKPEFRDIFPAHTDTPLSNVNSGNFAYNMNFFASADYDRRFGRHQVTAKVYTFYLKQVLDTGSSGITIMPYNRHTAGMELQYGYGDRYYAKFDVGYAGSDQFSPDKRYTAVPSAAAAWVVSNEGFMESADYLSNLKLRASYGVSANDRIGSDRFLYMDNIRSDGSELLIGNPDLTAEKMYIQNYGIDIGLVNAFSVTFDYFDVRNNSMLIGSQNLYPGYMGTSGLAVVNQGRMKNRGWELGVDYRKNINSDLSVWAGAGISYTKNKVVYTGEIASDDYYLPYRTHGYGASTIFGYRVDYSNGNGFINTQQELDKYTPMYEEGGIGTPRLGDLIYRDLNGDGVINEKDMDYLGQGIPSHYYSLTGGARYKSFELNFILIGGSGSKLMMVTPPNIMDGIFTDIHRNAWTAERYASGDRITYPALYIANSPSMVSSDYFLNNSYFVTLRNVELAYCLPGKWGRKIGSEKIRVTLSARNLFTIDGMKSKYVDPRVGDFFSFQPYRQYSIGLSAMF